MSTFRSAEEAKKNYVEKMGEPLGSLFEALWQEVAWLYREWNEYVALFGTKPSRVTLLNKAAPTFFRLVQDSLREGVLLHIARLTDPITSPGKPRKSNLTIHALAPLIRETDVAHKVRDLAQKALEASDFCRDWRNRHIAHRDLDLALSTGANSLKPASREAVKVSLDRITDVLNAVSSHYMESTLFFETPDHPGGAVSLLYLLEDGIKVEAERRKRREGGEICGDDFTVRDI